MMARSHLVTGWAAWTAASALAGPPRLIPLTFGGLAAGVGVLLPDIDRRGVGNWLAGGHRKLTHTALACGVVAAGGAAGARVLHGPAWPWLALLAGYAMHLAGDSLTRSGVPWLGPFTWRCYWLLPERWRFATGGRRWYAGGVLVARSPATGESAAVAVIAALAALIVWWRWF